MTLKQAMRFVFNDIYLHIVEIVPNGPRDIIAYGYKSVLRKRTDLNYCKVLHFLPASNNEMYIYVRRIYG